MQLNTQLTFHGQCEEALLLYEKCLGCKLAFKMTYGESPLAGETPADWHGKIMHARLVLGNAELTGADLRPGQAEPYVKPQGFALQLNLSDVAEAGRIFQALAEDGTVEMPMQKTFWALRFGALVDRFGIPWVINCEESTA